MGLVVSGEENPTTIRWFTTYGTRRHGRIGEGGMAAGHSRRSSWRYRIAAAAVG